MTDIPEDIMKAAESAFNAALDAIALDPGNYSIFDEHLARAILVERQACEKIARDEAKKAHRVGSDLQNMREYQANVIADLISARSS